MQNTRNLKKRRIRNLIKRYKPRKQNAKKYLPSSVLIPLVEKNNDPQILFIKRTNLVKHHKGEISYPGGTKEQSDRNLRDTLLREINEELGISSSQIDILGYIDEQITLTNFLVRPYIGYLMPPFELNLNKFEIADVIYIPISHLINQISHEEVIMRDRNAMILYTYYYGKYTIWGATARILHNFFDIIKLQA